MKATAKSKDKFVSTLTMKLTEGGLIQSELADNLGICRASMTNKLRNPDTFTLREIRKIIRSLNYTDSDILRCLG